MSKPGIAEPIREIHWEQTTSGRLHSFLENSALKRPHLDKGAGENLPPRGV